jgi:hypothetical protein
MIAFEPLRVSMSMLKAKQGVVAARHAPAVKNASPQLREIILNNVQVTTLANFYVVYIAQHVVRLTDKVTELYKQRECRAGHEHLNLQDGWNS